MFGKRYFATRKRLVEVAEEIRALAKETGYELEGFAPGGGHLEGLRNPFLFVVCGEVNAGKSTLINGLFGADMCAVNILPETEKVLWYRHGEERNVEATPVLEERYREIDFLQDFNIVDTPGTNSVKRGHEAITERFLPVADLVLFVFPVNNPWGAATWDFIARFPEELKGKVAFVLQQKDLRDENELEIIKGHMCQLAVQKLGEEPEVFAVSGKMAMEAKANEPFEERRWQESGYPALEDFISGVVTGSPTRQKVLRTVRDAAADALRGIEDCMEERTRVVEAQGRFLRELDGEVDGLRATFEQGSAGRLGGVDEVYLEEGQEVGKLLGSRVGVWATMKSLFRQDETPALVEQDLSRGVEEGVKELMEAAAGEMEDLCRDHWRGAEERLQERLEVAAEDLQPQGDFEAARARLVRRMSRAARQAVFGVKLRGLLEMELERRRNTLRRFVALALFLLAVGGGLGAAGLHPWSWLATAAAGLSGILGLVQTRLSIGALVRWFEDRIKDSEEAFVGSLRKDFLEGVRGFFSDYARMLEGGRKAVTANKAKLKPCLQQWNALYVELKSIEQDL